MSNKNEKIEKEFNVFREMVIHQNASPEQIEDCKIVFFAGASAMFSVLNELMFDKDNVESQRQFASVLREIDAFAKNIPATEKPEKHYDS